MCSILFTRTTRPLPAEALRAADRLAKFRGPDFTGMTTANDAYGAALTFVHHLLDISGQAKTQPVIFTISNGPATLLFNGEIYEYDSTAFPSDTDYLVSRIKQRGTLPAESLDGEYNILLYDRNANILSVLTDTFLTKPLFIGSKWHNSDLGISTFASSLKILGFDQIVSATPNSYYEFRFHSHGYTLTKTHDIVQFSLEQHVPDFDVWTSSFLQAVEKRARHGRHLPFVPLSSGYDSGAICLALNLLGIPYETYTIASNESSPVLKGRIALNTSASCSRAHVIPSLSKKQSRSLADDLRTFVESLTYSHENAPNVRISLAEDAGALGLNYIALKARESDMCVALSGAGADELYSDYGFAGKKFYYHSEFGGEFPSNLDEFFPWKKFFGDSMRSYLLKDEFVLGRHGIEGRYPFLDQTLVQAFLSLTPELKNREYKAPIANFLRRHRYPFLKDVKQGFIPTQHYLAHLPRFAKFQAQSRTKLRGLIRRILKSDL